MKPFLLCAVALIPPEALLAATPNTLTEEEKKDGWILLFDGRTTRHWMTPKGNPVPASHVQDGSLNPHPTDYMLVFRKPFADYVLSLDVKISPKCNSGIFFRTYPLKPKPGRDVGWNGMEIAIDDTKTAGYHDSGAIYDLVKPTENRMKPAGEWNRFVLTSKGHLITVAVNGKVVAKMNVEEWDRKGTRADGSKHKFDDIAYRDHPRRGFIGLQDHGSDCWFRNIKLKPLK